MTSREVIREVVVEGLTRPIPPVVPRDVAIPRLAERASVIKGVRRSGKTFRLFQRMGGLSLRVSLATTCSSSTSRTIVSMVFPTT